MDKDVEMKDAKPTKGGKDNKKKGNSKDNKKNKDKEVTEEIKGT